LWLKINAALLSASPFFQTRQGLVHDHHLIHKTLASALSLHEHCCDIDCLWHLRQETIPVAFRITIAIPTIAVKMEMRWGVTWTAGSPMPRSLLGTAGEIDPPRAHPDEEEHHGG
jgi:hypothetical protein